MANYYAEFDSTPATIVADLKARILNSSNWSNISGGTGNVLSATTVRGAQMAIDLSDAAATTRTLQVGVYRTYASSAGTDKLIRFVNYRNVTVGATTDPVHVTVSAGPDHLFFVLEGPRAGEPNPDSAAGSARQCLFLGDLVPYFSGDSPTVVLLASIAALTQNTDTVWVSRNRANNASWVPARLATLTFPNVNIVTPWFSQQRATQADGNTYLWPYVVIEDTAGLRGRIAKAFYAGWQEIIDSPTSPDFPPALYGRLVYNSENYILVMPTRAAGSTNFSRSGFGWSTVAGTNALGNAPVIAVPTA